MGERGPGRQLGLRDAHLAAGLCGAVHVTRRTKQRMRSIPLESMIFLLLRRAGFPLRKYGNRTANTIRPAAHATFAVGADQRAAARTRSWRSRAVAKRISIPRCRGSNPAAPARQCVSVRSCARSIVLPSWAPATARPFAPVTWE